MPDQDLLLIFFTSSLLLGLAPGPDNLFVLAQSALQGVRAGLLVTLGLCTGLLGHTALVAFGVAALFQSSALAFTLLKAVGAAYLLYLAWQAFRAGGAGAAPAAELVPPAALRLYRRGVVMNLSNPKVSIFFIAFLPQFADPAAGALIPQFLLLGVLFILATLVVFGTLSLMAGRIGRRLGRSAAYQRWLQRAAGALFAGLAVRLLLTER